MQQNSKPPALAGTVTGHRSALRGRKSAYTRLIEEGESREEEGRRDGGKGWLAMFHGHLTAGDKKHVAPLDVPIKAPCYAVTHVTQHLH